MPEYVTYSHPVSNPTPAALLIRVSSAGQAKEDRYGIDAQRAACYQYAQHNNLDIRQEYVDTISGTKDNREHLNRLLEETECYHAVVIFHTDRIARTELLSYKILKEFDEAKRPYVGRIFKQAKSYSMIDVTVSCAGRVVIPHSLFRTSTTHLPLIGESLSEAEVCLEHARAHAALCFGRRKRSSDVLIVCAGSRYSTSRVHARGA